MAANNTSGVRGASPGGQSTQSGQLDLAQLKRELLQGLKNRVLRADLSDDPSQVNGWVGAFLRDLSPEKIAAALENGGIEQVKRQLLDSLAGWHRLDVLEQKPFENLSWADGDLDSKKSSVPEERGNYKLAGKIASDAHAIARILKELGVDKNGIGEQVAGAVTTALHAGGNLCSRETWKAVVPNIVLAALSTPGGAAAKAAGAVVAGVQAAASHKPAASVERPASGPSPVVRNPSLTPNAGSTSNTGSARSALAVRAALLSGLANQSEKVERTAGQVLSAILKSLGSEPSKERKKELHAELKSLLTDSSSTNRKADPAKIMQRVVQEFSKVRPGNQALGELSDLIGKALSQSQGESMGPGLEAAIATVVASSLGELVAARLGEEPKGESKLDSEILPMLRDLLGSEAGAASAKQAQASDTRRAESGSAAPIQGSDEPTSAGQVDLSRWSVDRPDIEQRFKDAALKALLQEGMSPEHERSIELMHAFGEVLQNSFDTQSGQVDPVRLALNLQRWLATFAGGSEQSVSVLDGQLQAAIQAQMKAEQALASAKERHAQLQAQQASSTDRQQTAPLEAELTTLTHEINALESQFQKGQAALAEDIGRLQKDGLKRLAEFVIHGRRCDEGAASSKPSVEAAPGGAGGGDGGGRVPPSAGGPESSGRGRRHFDRDFAPTVGVIPGFNAGGRPADEYGKDLSIQQERAIKCGEILADPSLTIEDKIFLFMMWFVAFADKEREGKLEELVQMDRDTARIQKLKDEKLSDLNSLRESKKTDEARVLQAEAAYRRAEREGVPEDQLSKLRGAFDDAKKTLDTRDDKIKLVEAEHAELKRQQDQAPKSREVLFMEIERINQLRDKIMNMARSMLENSNRQAEKIFR